jgi:hypothetical protein
MSIPDNINMTTLPSPELLIQSIQCPLVVRRTLIIVLGLLEYLRSSVSFEPLQSITRAYFVQLHLQYCHHVLLDYKRLVIELFDDEGMILAVYLDDDGLDGWIALDKNA